MVESVSDRMLLPRWTEDSDTPNRGEFDSGFANLEARAAGWLPPDTLANRPAAAAALDRFLYWAHDTDQVFICVDTDGAGTYEWIEVPLGGGRTPLHLAQVLAADAMPGGATRILATANLLSATTANDAVRVGGAAGVLSAVPFKVEEDESATEIAQTIENASATAGAEARLGVYEDGGDGTPGALLADFGTIAVDSTGEKTITGLAQALTGGAIHWYAYLTEHGDERITGDNDLHAFFGIAYAATNTPFGKLYADAAPGWGALPDPFPAIGPGAIADRTHLIGTYFAKLGV